MKPPSEITKSEGTTFISSTLRPLTSAHAVATGVPPTTLSKLLKPDGLTMKSMKILNIWDSDAFSRKEIETDIPTAVKLLEKEVRQRIKGSSYSLITDSASLEHENVINILVSVPSEPKPFLLISITSDIKGKDYLNPNSSVYSFETAGIVHYFIELS